MVEKLGPPLSWKVAGVAFNELEKADITGGIGLLRLIELYQISCRRFQMHEYDQTISLCWAVCEAIISQLWEHHLQKTFKDFGREAELSNARLSKLNRTSETSKLELLEAHGVINSNRMKELKILRSTRNKVVHEIVRVSLAQANQAIVCIKDLFHEAFGIRLTIMVSHPESYARRWIASTT